MERHAIDTSVGDLRQVVAIGTEPKPLVHVVGGGCIEMNGLPRLCRLRPSGDRRSIVWRIPEVVDAPARLSPLCGIRCNRIVRMNVEGVATKVDIRGWRILPDGNAEIRRKPLIDWHSEDSMLGPLENERTYR